MKKCNTISICVQYNAVKSSLVMGSLQTNEELRTVNGVEIPDWLIKNR